MLAVHCLSALQVYNEMFTDATSERTERMFHYLDPDNTGYVDYLGWSQSIKLQVRNLTMITRYRTCCRNAAVLPALLHLHRCDSRQPSWCDMQQSMFSKLASDAKLSPGVFLCSIPCHLGDWLTKHVASPFAYNLTAQATVCVASQPWIVFAVVASKM